jgi:uncharacterized tellurite resistance protein B-like protein
MSNTAPLDIVTKSQLNILIQLAKADKEFAQEEKDIIYRVCRERNFPETKVTLMMQNPEPIGTLGALSPNQKLQYLLSCIELVLADNKIQESEVILCQAIAIKMGFRKSIIDFLIQNKLDLKSDHVRARVLSEL